MFFVFECETQNRKWSCEQKDVALVRAARNNRREATGVVSFLIDHGATPGCIRLGTTALCEAVKSGPW